MPGLNLWGFLTPPVAGADFLAALVASYFLGALAPVDFLAVCLVLAIVFFFLESFVIYFLIILNLQQSYHFNSRVIRLIFYCDLIGSWKLKMIIF